MKVTGAGGITYHAADLNEVAAYFDWLAHQELSRSLAPKETVAVKRFHSGMHYAYLDCAKILRSTTIAVKI